MIKLYDSTNPEHWIQSEQVDTETKQIISTMPEYEKKAAFSGKRLAFGTAGIRGKMGPGTQRLNKFVYQQMAVGFCKWIKASKKENPCIVIGHDNRINSDVFAMECAKVAIANGINVYLFEDNKLMPTPIISYTIRRLKANGGINITASHNPKEDNGFKAYNASGSQILPDEAKRIVNGMPATKDILNITEKLNALKLVKGRITYINYDKITNEYFDEVIKNSVINKNFLSKDYLIKKQPIVFTGFQGTTAELMPKFLKKLGFKRILSVPGQDKISGKFEASPISNPENIKAFDKAIEFANEKKSVIIFGVDPDGDRFTIGFKKTNRWRFLNGNEMGIAFVYYILKYRKFEKKPFILSSHVSTNYIDKIAADFNCQVIRTKTGFKWMCNAMDSNLRTGSFVCAFEEAIGSLVHTATRDKDSFGSACLALEIYAMANNYHIDIHEYLQEEIFAKYGDTYSETISYTVVSNDWVKDANELMKKALHFKPCTLFDYQLIKVYRDKKADAIVWQLDKNSSIKFRISGTEPKFKVYINLNEQLAGQLKAAAVELLATVKKEILAGYKLK